MNADEKQQQHGPEMNNGRRRERATGRLTCGDLLVGNESDDDELQPDQRAGRRPDDDVGFPIRRVLSYLERTVCLFSP